MEAAIPTYRPPISRMRRYESVSRRGRVTGYAPSDSPCQRIEVQTIVLRLIWRQDEHLAMVNRSYRLNRYYQSFRPPNTYLLFPSAGKTVKPNLSILPIICLAHNPPPNFHQHLWRGRYHEDVDLPLKFDQGGNN
jgi:hypothetical protein